MAKRKKKRNVHQMSMFAKEEREEYSHLPSFTSTPDEIRKAVEQNAFDRGTLLIKIKDNTLVEKLK